MPDESGFLAFAEEWSRKEGMRFMTADGASSYERALRAYAGMIESSGEEGYAMTSKVHAKPDFFPLLTDSLDDGLMYEMGFTLQVNGTDAGRIERYVLSRPNRVTFYTPDMSVSVRIRGLHIAKRGDARRSRIRTGSACTPYGTRAASARSTPRTRTTLITGAGASACARNGRRTSRRSANGPCRTGTRTA